jgi:hypothetical protein
VFEQPAEQELSGRVVGMISLGGYSHFASSDALAGS